ncbi:hypothetical protein F5Y01DRAFT_328962 [Xylaria sp. FL0043]|nr:hypothetical protein F5Y01DRAFT_328962 [Xylaria sp. FL0043]
MALDPLTALGLAGNIIQFVNFTAKLASGTSAVYKSAAGTSIDNAIIESIAKDAQRLSSVLQDIEDCPKELEDLVIDSGSLAEDLLDLLAKLKVQGRKTKWKSFVAALKGIWDNHKVVSFLWKISSLQAQIGYHIQALLLDQQSETRQAICQLEEENKRLGSAHCGELKALEQTILEKLQELKVSAPRIPIQDDNSDIQKDCETIDPSQVVFLSSQVGVIGDELHKLHKKGRDILLHQSVLKSLFFKRLHWRYEAIVRAHRETFRWVFDDQHPETLTSVPLRSWLRSRNGTFWIQGKAGSGKSTFMKFLCDSKETDSHLRVWSGDRDLVTARFFFWKGGKPLQKSLSGLLRALIFEVLRQCPATINDISLTDHGMPLTESSWTLDRLLDTIEILTDLDISTAFCFFIDGLDEYEGCTAKLINTLEMISKNPHIKICVSSRPFTEFLDEYGKQPSRLLKLEDLTRGDIRCYVLGILTSNNRFRILSENDPTYLSLVEQVVAKAQGVFLWVFLAVRSLLEGLRYEDRITDMSRRLSKFPKDLESFFYKMLTSVPSFYRRHTARAFQTALSSEDALQLMLYSFLDDIDENPGFVFELKTNSMTDSRITLKIEQMRKQLDARTKGLLEVFEEPRNLDGEPIPFFGLRVGYLHRSVKDYLETSRKVRDLFRKHLEPSFDIQLYCSMAYLALFKSHPYTETSVARYTGTYIDEIVFRAKEMQCDSVRRRETHRILAEAEHAMRVICDVWNSELLEPHAVLARSIQEGLHRYVVKAIRTNPSLVNLKKPCLLDLALRPSDAHFDTSWPLPAMVRTLLKYGASPNQQVSHSSVWGLFLQRLARRDYLGRFEENFPPGLKEKINDVNFSEEDCIDNEADKIYLKTEADETYLDSEVDEAYLDKTLQNPWKVCFGPNGESTAERLTQQCVKVVQMLISKEADLDTDIRLFIHEVMDHSNVSNIGPNQSILKVKVKARSFLHNAYKFRCPELHGIVDSLPEKASHGMITGTKSKENESTDDSDECLSRL